MFSTILAQFSRITAHFCDNSLRKFSIFSAQFSGGLRSELVQKQRPVGAT